MEKIYTLSGCKTQSFIAEFTEAEMLEAGYNCPKEYANDCDIWETADVREGDQWIEVYDVDEEMVDVS